MVYLILEILGFLIAAAAIGCAVGWLCRSIAIARRGELAAMRARAAEGDFAGQREQLEARLSEAAGAGKVLQEEVAHLHYVRRVARHLLSQRADDVRGGCGLRE